VVSENLQEGKAVFHLSNASYREIYCSVNNLFHVGNFHDDELSQWFCFPHLSNDMLIDYNRLFTFSVVMHPLKTKASCEPSVVWYKDSSSEDFSRLVNINELELNVSCWLEEALYIWLL